MTLKSEFNENAIKPEGDALDQSMALNKITMKLLEKKHKEDMLTKAILLVSILVNLAIVGVFIAYENQFVTIPATTETVTTTTSTTTQDVDGENAQINNVQGNQYKDNSTHNEEVAK